MIFSVDAFGGDNSPSAVIEGCVLAMAQNDDFSIILVGDEAKIRAELERYSFDPSRVEICHAPDIVTCDESPTNAIKHKKDSSLVKAIQLVADKCADCVISAGSSGALLAGATLIIRRLPGVKRPALAPVLPSLQGPVMLIDCGANTDCRPEYLLQFAHMGNAYMRSMLDITPPRVGLINNGEEEGKGNELTKATYALLKEDAGLSFVGNCEARDVMSGDYDVLICDGFVGNAILKSMEGTIHAVMKMLKTELRSSKISAIGAVMSRRAFGTLKRRMDYKEYGGAPLLGVNGGVIKAHGSSDSKAICSAIGQARKLVLGDVTNKISAAIALGLSENDAN